MKSDNLHKLSQNPPTSEEDLTTENSSLSSDSDTEDMASDQQKIVQVLRKTIRRNNTKINDLDVKLTISEIHLSSEKEKSNYKDGLIKTLNLSLDLTNQTKDLGEKQLQSQISELKNALDLSKSQALIKEKERSGLVDSNNQYKKNIKELNSEISKYKCAVKDMDDELFEIRNKVQERDDDLKENEDHIARLNSKIKTNEANIFFLLVFISSFLLLYIEHLILNVNV
ncbi:spindle pole body protein pcp1-like [Drosophila subpulchrella]|uniref:spindle pole body protein pcp1-like n=1 Tax=Drosophila subpulchrella TaxID=1486046 RepID=UPI0018A14142|nr:spindle pole body protein pcp1-like [Drosophila subpulchrella]